LEDCVAKRVKSLPKPDRLLDWCEEPLREGGKRPRSVRDLRVRIGELREEQAAAWRAEAAQIAETVDVQAVPAQPYTVAVEVATPEPGAKVIPLPRPSPKSHAESFYAVIATAEESFVSGDYSTARSQLRGAIIILERLERQRSAGEQGPTG